MTGQKRKLSTCFGVAAATGLSPKDPRVLFPDCPLLVNIIKHIADSKEVPTSLPIGGIFAVASWATGSAAQVRSCPLKEPWCNLTIWEAAITPPGAGALECSMNWKTHVPKREI